MGVPAVSTNNIERHALFCDGRGLCDRIGDGSDTYASVDSLPRAVRQVKRWSRNPRGGKAQRAREGLLRVCVCPQGPVLGLDTGLSYHRHGTGFCTSISHERALP